MWQSSRVIRGLMSSFFVVMVLGLVACVGESPASNPSKVSHPITVSATPVDGPFPGRWQSIDGDNSTQTLSVTNDAAMMHFTYYDDGATICGGKPAQGTGSAVYSSYTIAVPFAFDCLNPQTFWGNTTVTFTYTLATDTLKDNIGIIWHRL